MKNEKSYGMGRQFHTQLWPVPHFKSSSHADILPQHLTGWAHPEYECFMASELSIWTDEITQGNEWV